MIGKQTACGPYMHCELIFVPFSWAEIREIAYLRMKCQQKLNLTILQKVLFFFSYKIQRNKNKVTQYHLLLKMICLGIIEFQSKHASFICKCTYLSRA